MWTDTKVDNVDYILADDWNDMAIAVTSFIASKGTANGLAELDSTGHVPTTQLPSSVVNVQSDWNETATNSDAFIKNKPTIPDPYTLPTASESILGGIKVGSRLSITDGVLSADAQGGSYTLPVATDSILGGVKIGNGITITDGVISATTPVQSNWNESNSGALSYIQNKPSIPAAQVNSDWTATEGVSVILNKPTIPAAQIQSDWNQSNNSSLDYIKNKPTIPSPQVNSDWNAESGVASILNKPTIPSAQVQSDWNATEGMGVILNKPTLGSIASHDSGEFATSTHNHDATYLGINSKAADSNLLDGMDSAAFATSGHLHTGTYEPSNANIQSHIIATNNPHGVTYNQVGAEPANANIQSHISSTSNPHSVTYSQIGAAPTSHVHGSFDNSTALTGANVYSLVTTEDGIVTGLTSRALTASDIGAATTSTKLDDFATPDDNTDLNANTTNHGLLLKATAPAANTLNVVGIANGETAYTNKTLFDATNPAMDGTASPGTSLYAAHRDHVHPTDTSRAASSHTHAESDITNLVTDLSNKQPLDTTLTSLAGLTTAADKMIYFTASDTATTCDITSAARSLLDDTTTSSMLTTLSAASSTTATLNVYVDKAATGAGTGVDWTNAFTTVQAAVDSLPAIINHAVTIYVRKGTTAYAENLTIKRVVGSGTITLQGELYWYGTVASAGGTPTTQFNLSSSDPNYASRASISAGDPVMMMKWTPGSVENAAPLKTVYTTVASVSGTTVTLTDSLGEDVTTSWTYTILHTVISPASNTGISILDTMQVYLTGLHISGGIYGINVLNCRNLTFTAVNCVNQTSNCIALGRYTQLHMSKIYLYSTSVSNALYASQSCAFQCNASSINAPSHNCVQANYGSSGILQYCNLMAGSTGLLALNGSLIAASTWNLNTVPTTPKNPATWAATTDGSVIT